MTREDLLRNVSAMSASGKSAAEIQKYISRNINNIRGLHGEALNSERRAKIVRETLAMAGDEITRQRVRTGYARQLTESTAEDRAKDAEMMETFKQIAQNSMLTASLLKQVEINEQLREQKRLVIQEDSQGESRLSRQSIDSQLRVSNTPSGTMFLPPSK